jgi:23S rRNA (uracil1939-C5)-methyltransferase
MLEKICPYFNRCGGCVWQDLPQKDYITKKENFVRFCFRDAGIDIDLNPLVLIPTGTRRRASFSFIRGHLGFNAVKSHQIVEIESCPLLLDKINDFLPNLRKIIKQLNTSGDLFIASTDMGLDIHIRDKSGLPDLNKLELLTSLNQYDGVARVVYNDTPIFEKGIYGGSADNFAQPSKEGEKALIDLVMQNTDNVLKAVDLFCGSGTFTRPLIEKGISTTGYDSVPQAIARLGENGVVRDLFRRPLLPEELYDVDLIVLDPPRSGALAQCQQLAELEKGRIVMVSCNPKTAARDIKVLLNSGWKLGSITPVDQFTYTNHVEIVAVLTK